VSRKRWVSFCFPIVQLLIFTPQSLLLLLLISVNPIYYVMFTASTIFASFLLFRGFNTAGAPAVSLLGGFIVIFVGVYLLNLNRLIDPVTQQPRVSLVTGEGLAGTGRLSEHHERLLNGDGYHANHSRFSLGGRESMSQYPPSRRGRQTSEGSILFNAYDDNDESVGLTRLAESSEQDSSSYRDTRISPKSHKKHNLSDGIPIRSSSNDASHQLLDNDTPDSHSNHRR
jgi:magnesium transporter